MAPVSPCMPPWSIPYAQSRAFFRRTLPRLEPRYRPLLAQGCQACGEAVHAVAVSCYLNILLISTYLTLPTTFYTCVVKGRKEIVCVPLGRQLELPGTDIYMASAKNVSVDYFDELYHCFAWLGFVSSRGRGKIKISEIGRGGYGIGRFLYSHLKAIFLRREDFVAESADDALLFDSALLANLICCPTSPLRAFTKNLRSLYNIPPLLLWLMNYECGCALWWNPLPFAKLPRGWGGGPEVGWELGFLTPKD